MVFSVKWMVAMAMVVSLVGCDAARILALFPTPSRSHIIAFEALTKELAARGHHLTVVSSFPQKDPIANYTDIFVPKIMFDIAKINMFDMADLNIFSETLLHLFLFSKISLKSCEYYLEDPGVQELIHAKNDKYDLLLVEVFFSECFLGFAHKFNAPVVGIVPMGGMHWMLNMVGNPSPFAYTPNALLNYGHHMTFLQRLHNSVTLTLAGWLRTFVTLPRLDAVMKKHFSAYEPLPYVGDICSNTSVLLLNNHVSLGYPRPLLPNVIEVGGMHLKQGQKLPQDLKKYLDESKDGVIYFSMGSNLKSAELPESKRRAFLEAFSKIKQRVLWKWDEDAIADKPNNVRLGKWLPQAAILEHPNVKLFITHGGLLSTQEAVYHAMPVIGIPVFADQRLNMNRAQQLGFGLTLEFSNVTSESLLWALDSVLNQPSFRKNAQQMSARFRDQPETPLETAVYWTEYVLRHNGAPHLRSAALDLAWYQYFLLDVIAVLALATGAVALALYVAVRALIALVWGRKGKQREIMKQQKKTKKQN